jgi:lipoate-protein ligase A
MADGKSNRWRFLNSRFGNAFFNMAVDEAVARSVERGTSPPTLRVFGWSPPAISFGYAQRVERDVSLEKCRRAGIDWVRRPTGGRAVLHWNELTYSVLCTADDSHLGGKILEAYEKISVCLVAGIRRLGVDARFEPHRQRLPSPRGERVANPCFSSTAQFEVVVEGKKLVGSAQRRMGSVLLQHGSLLIGPEHKRIVDLMPYGDARVKAHFRQELDAHTLSLEEIVGRAVQFEEVAQVLREGFEERLDVALEEAQLSPEEAKEAERLTAEKYGAEAWNLSARAPVRR